MDTNERQQIDDLVLDFFETLFTRIFSDRFKADINQRRKTREVTRQIDAAADAASQSLSRFFASQGMELSRAGLILKQLSNLDVKLQLKDISYSSITPESKVSELLNDLPCPAELIKQGKDAEYRLALFSVVQVLMLVGPVMAEWSRLSFATTFEVPKRVVSRLNQISEQISAFGSAQRDQVDQNYELLYRDYLMQRFHRVEVGTVKMTSNLAVDLRTLFVMPRVLPRDSVSSISPANTETDTCELMHLSAARDLLNHRRPFSSGEKPSGDDDSQEKGLSALEQVISSNRNVIIGLPGSGKSTFLEWLQLKIAGAEETLILDDQQAIPLLLRVRQLDANNLPHGSELIIAATSSQDTAAVMPPDWLNRQMLAGRVLLMLDGLDETSQELRDQQVVPWLKQLIKRYPDCRYIVTSRPVGYPAGELRKQHFEEANLLDFNQTQIKDYLCHWCTAVRLAQEESEAEALREGKADGEQILKGFQEHPYICDLARTPLMLSAICLVNYFEHGRLPEDRARLYRLCVEGLLHHWDQRRGIHSDFGLEEKLRACRSVALAIQADDKAEWEVDRIAPLFEQTLGDATRGNQLLEHIRYRTGLLLERRPGVYAFAHLTFQEYLAALAIYEGNPLEINSEQLAQEHNDHRWQEVIPLYCGLATTPMAQALIKSLVAQPDSRFLSTILTEAWFAANSEMRNNKTLRNSLLVRAARSPRGDLDSMFDKFPDDLVSPITNQAIGTINSDFNVSTSYAWINDHSEFLDLEQLSNKLSQWQSFNSIQLCELVELWHRHALQTQMEQSEFNRMIYSEVGPAFNNVRLFINQAEVALYGLMNRTDFIEGFFPEKIWLNVIHLLHVNLSDLVLAITFKRFSYFEEKKIKIKISSTLQSKLTIFLAHVVKENEVKSNDKLFDISQGDIANTKKFIYRLEKDQSHKLQDPID